MRGVVGPAPPLSLSSLQAVAASDTARMPATAASRRAVAKEGLRCIVSSLEDAKVIIG